MISPHPGRNAVCVRYLKQYGHNPWLSEDPHTQAWACEACLDCPGFGACQVYVEEVKTFPGGAVGVYAGEIYPKRRLMTIDELLHAGDEARKAREVQCPQCEQYFDGHRGLSTHRGQRHKTQEDVRGSNQETEPALLARRGGGHGPDVPAGDEVAAGDRRPAEAGPHDGAQGADAQRGRAPRQERRAKAPAQSTASRRRARRGIGATPDERRTAERAAVTTALHWGQAVVSHRLDPRPPG